MHPGQIRRARIWVANRGRTPASLQLTQFVQSVQPGIGGGSLLDRLKLRINEVARSKLGTGIPRARVIRTVFSGRISEMRKKGMGSLRPHRARGYRFRVTFPDAGSPSGPTSGDNAYQGARLRVGYRWKLR